MRRRAALLSCVGVCVVVAVGACSSVTPGTATPAAGPAPTTSVAPTITETTVPTTTSAPETTAPAGPGYCELTVTDLPDNRVEVRSGEGPCGETLFNDDGIFYSGPGKPAVRLQYNPQARLVVLSGGGTQAFLKQGESRQFGVYAAHVVQVTGKDFVVDLR